MHVYTEAELIALGLGIDVDPDAELCRKQREDQAAGKIAARIQKNIYGYCVADTMNDGGGRMSPNFKSLEEAKAWAADWVAKDPAKNTLFPEKFWFV
jgi:hypothetical protein